MKLIAIIPPPADPSLARNAYGAMLGEGWEVFACSGQDEVPDEVAAEAEFVVSPPPATIDARLLKRAPNLRLIQVPGHGFDHVNLADARAAGVPVATIASSGAEAHTVAEMTIILAGVAGRRILEGDRFIREGSWGNLVMLRQGVFELAGKTLGLIGFGRIGKEVAKRARPFDLHVVYHDIVRLDPAVEEGLGVEYRDLEGLLRDSDIVSLHAPLTPGTRHIINDRTLALMKPQAVLVNTARGPLVDADALARAVREGRIRAAAIDVFDPEPPDPANPLLSTPGIVLSPHMAGVTAESVMRIIAAAMENCRRVAGGEEPRDVVASDAAH